MSALRSMAERYGRPDWVRRINRMADSLGAPLEGARRLVSLDAGELIESAQRSLGLSKPADFGDPQWRSRVESLCRGADAAPLTVVGRLMTRQEILRGLRTRFLLGEALAREPRIAEQRIAAPVIVTGPARSGTSILFELFWLDPALRGPVASEVLHPFALPEHGGADRRLEITECEQELWADVAPEFAAIHELRSDLPVECVTLTLPSFCGWHWPMVLQMPGWVPDIDENYRFHRRILQALQHGSERRSWLLKTPAHLTTLAQVFALYPDAWIVQTHRDPAKTMPSTVSTTAMVQWMRTESVDLALSVAAITAVFGATLNHVTEQRAKGLLPDRVVDVHFVQLMKDPVGTLRAAYQQMGREFTPAHAERILRYLAEKPKGKFGVHKYTPEEWGMSAAGLREQLAPYIAHFGVALED
jgi:hypothetical protein